MIKVNKEKKIVDKVKSMEQVISMVMGILVVLAIGGLAYRYFQTDELPIPSSVKNQEEVENGDEEAIEVESEETGLPATHTVSQSENLWQIAEKYYLSGYNWVDIAEANDLVNPNLLVVGQELVIPDAERMTMTVSELPETGVGEEVEITGDRYTVEEGDSLSKIAIKAYGDMFQWPKIWGENRDQIANPNLIVPGMVLEIPRN